MYHCLLQITFPVCTALLFISTHNELRSIELRTLNSERLGILAKHWVQHKEILQPKEVSQMEGLWGHPKSQVDDFPVVVGSLEDLVSTPEEVHILMQQHQGDKYMVNLKQSPQMRIVVSLR